MTLKHPNSAGSIIELATDPALSGSYIINPRSLWLDTSVTPAKLYERNGNNTAWNLLSTAFYGMQADTFTATSNQISFNLSHTVLGGVSSVVTFYNEGGNTGYVLQDSDICTALSGQALTVVGGLAAGDKVMFIYPRSN